MKAEPLRWTLGQAASEFSLDRRTMAERVKTSGAVPGEDGKFSTRQITAAVYGDLAGEKLRKMRAEADLAEMEVREKQKTSIPVEIYYPEIERCFGAIASVIRSSGLPERERNEIFAELRDVGVKMQAKGYADSDQAESELTGKSIAEDQPNDN